MTFLFLFVFVTTRFAVSGSRTPDPLVEFQLLRNDCIGASSMFPDSSPSNYLGGVQRDVDRTECIRGNGVSAKANAAQGKAALASTYAIGGLMPHLRGSELSIEFWVRSSDSIVCETVLLGFAARDEMSPYSFHLTQRPVNDPHQAGHMRMLARNKAGSVLSLESSLLHQGEYSHVVIDLRYLSPIFAGKKFSMISENTTVNATTGMSTEDGSFSGTYDIAAWDPSYVLQFFSSEMKTSNQLIENFWSGELLFFAMYNRSLTKAEIRRNYAAGLPNSLPVVWSQVTRIQEDGQHSLGPSYDQVFYGDVPLPFVSVIQLPVFDVDDTSAHPNYKSSASAHTYSIAYITSLPAKGSLYAPLLSNYTGNYYPILNITGWEEVISVPWPVQIGTLSASAVVNPLKDVYEPIGIDFGHGIIAGHFIKYRPRRDEHSSGVNMYDSFEISATDGRTGDISLEIATIEIYVSALNDPPIATPSVIEAFAAIPRVIPVTGTDVDSTVGGARIARLPLHGTLYQVHANSSVAFGQRILAAPTNLWSMAVAYVYSGPENGTVLLLPQYVRQDSFEIQVFDSVAIDGRAFGLLSLAAVVNISVLPAVYALGQSAVTTLEATRVVIPMFGEDRSSGLRHLKVEIVEVPKYGHLYDYFTGTELFAGSVLSHSLLPGPRGVYSEPVNVTYIGNNYYFSRPVAKHNGSIISTSASDSFLYRVKTRNNAFSPSESQEIVVRNRNHATNISFTYPSDGMDRFTIYQLGSVPTATYASELSIFGFSLTDTDKDTNVMRLSISTMGGFVDLNPAYVGFLTFNGLTYCREAEWQCAGNGVDDTIISAVGTAFNIKNALNGMVFRSILFGYIDIVNVTIYDGVGSDCVSQTVVDRDTFQTGCHMRSTSLKVQVEAVPLGYQGVKPGLLTDPYVPIQYLFFITLICCACCCLFLSCKFCQKKQEDKYLKAGFVAPAHIRSRPFPINLCSECDVYPVSYAFTKKKTKRSKVDRDVESQVSLDDVNVVVDGERGAPPCHWVPCDRTRKKKHNFK